MEHRGAVDQGIETMIRLVVVKLRGAVKVTAYVRATRRVVLG